MSHDIAEDEIAILPELILTNLAASSRTKVITALAMLLERHQIVKPGVASALVSRERLLPAGVATLVPVALCHAERPDPTKRPGIRDPPKAGVLS
ncbi:MAG TPA: PTS sugar transporter subunit IIA [Anaerolineales bacterium]|nr:PTS sugar transporter subunit IIA [Anaerolineales bacterium]